MRMIGFSEFDAGPGRVIVWKPAAHTMDTARIPSGQWAPPSYNQRARLKEAAAQRRPEDRRKRWSVSTVRIPGHADLGALEAAFGLFSRRHGTLLSGFCAENGDFRRFMVTARDVTLERSEVGSFATRHETLVCLERIFDTHTNPLEWPACLFGIVVGEFSSWVFMAFDHLHVDLQSHAIVVHEIHSLYLACRGHRGADLLPRPGSCLSSAEAERRFEGASAELDAAVAYWIDLTQRAGGTLPPFPLDVGAPPGSRLPLSSEEIVLLDEAATERFDTWCRSNGGTFFCGLLAATGITAREMTDEEVFRTIIPVRTRDDPTGPAIGWFTNGVPVEFGVAAGATLGEVMLPAQAACLAAHRHGAVPYERVLRLLPPAIRRDRASWFSYLDFRVFPGAESHETWNASILTCPVTGNGVDLWVNRTYRGTFVHLRYPKTPVAADLVHRYVRRIARTMTDVLPA